jgi:flagellar biosynthetic protein FliO
MTAADDLATIGRVIASLAVVMLFAALAARMGRRSRGGGAGIRVVNRVGLTREASLAVVEVGGTALVLGITAHGVSLLTALDPATLTPPSEPQPEGGPEGGPRPWRQHLDVLRDLTVRR